MNSQEQMFFEYRKHFSKPTSSREAMLDEWRGVGWQAALSSRSVSVPGWKLVPIEPTDKMLLAGLEHGGTGAGLAYKDMLADAPTVPQADAAPVAEPTRAEIEAQMLENYQWLREHSMFCNDSMQEI